MADRSDLPRYNELIYDTLRAVEALGGSAKGSEITDKVLELRGVSDDVASITYDNRPKSIYVDRVDWARSYAKLGGALESPMRGLFLLTQRGREILALPPALGHAEVDALDLAVREESARASAARRASRAVGQADQSRSAPTEQPHQLGDPPTDEAEPLSPPAEGEGPWEETLLRRLHRLSPDAFEEFVLYLLRAYGLDLVRVGGTGDEGIDGIGLAPISPVLSSRVAVQAKRWDPGKTIGREVVALFQRDASAKGAERAVLVTLGRYSDAARKAAFESTPTVDLIDGSRLCELAKEQEIGVHSLPTVDEAFFDRFEK